LASRQHTLTTYLWLTGAAAMKHCSRFSVFLGCPSDHARWQERDRIIRQPAPLFSTVPPLAVEFAETTKIKAGRHLEGVVR